MKQKDLLLKDLCNRLHCGVKIYLEDFPNATLVGVVNEGVILRCDKYEHVYDTPWNIEYVEPYLFPLSSMTEEQKEELITITDGKFRYMWGVITNAIPRKNTGEWGMSENAFIDGIEVINILYMWLLKNHFDINGLIPMGLAKDATGLNIY